GCPSSPMTRPLIDPGFCSFCSCAASDLAGAGGSWPGAVISGVAENAAIKGYGARFTNGAPFDATQMEAKEANRAKKVKRERGMGSREWGQGNRFRFPIPHSPLPIPSLSFLPFLPLLLPIDIMFTVYCLDRSRLSVTADGDPLTTLTV